MTSAAAIGPMAQLVLGAVGYGQRSAGRIEQKDSPSGEASEFGCGSTASPIRVWPWKLESWMLEAIPTEEVDGVNTRFR